LTSKDGFPPQVEPYHGLVVFVGFRAVIDESRKGFACFPEIGIESKAMRQCGPLWRPRSKAFVQAQGFGGADRAQARPLHGPSRMWFAGRSRRRCQSPNPFHIVAVLLLVLSVAYSAL
jgi:hypothetical protein